MLPSLPGCAGFKHCVSRVGKGQFPRPTRLMDPKNDIIFTYEYRLAPFAIIDRVVMCFGESLRMARSEASLQRRPTTIAKWPQAPQCAPSFVFAVKYIRALLTCSRFHHITMDTGKPVELILHGHIAVTMVRPLFDARFVVELFYTDKADGGAPSWLMN